MRARTAARAGRRRAPLRPYRETLPPVPGNAPLACSAILTLFFLRSCARVPLSEYAKHAARPISFFSRLVFAVLKSESPLRGTEAGFHENEGQCQWRGRPSP